MTQKQVKTIDDTFVTGKRYIMEHTHKAFGGGFFEVKVDEITEDLVKLNGKWHNAKTYLETRKIINEIK